MSNVDSKTITDPFSVYATPQAVLDDEHLPTATKLRILSAMEQDVVALQNAEGENMPGDGQRPAHLAEIRHAILSLDPEAEAHGDVAREHRADVEASPTLTKEQARQGEVLFPNTRQRNMFVVYIAVAVVALAVILFFARPWA